MPVHDFAGIENIDVTQNLHQEDVTFEYLLLRTRIVLQRKFTLDSVASAGCEFGSDHSGFHPWMEKGEGTSANLAVIGRGEVDDLQNDRI